jgi:hypothetical protein
MRDWAEGRKMKMYFSNLGNLGPGGRSSIENE